jgi:hypothetical protein
MSIRRFGTSGRWTRAAILMFCSASAAVWECIVVDALRTRLIRVGEDNYPMRASEHPFWFWGLVTLLQGLAPLIFACGLWTFWKKPRGPSDGAAG